MERCLFFLKPDGVIRRYVGARTIKEILSEDLDIEFFGKVSPQKDFFADQHYKEHKSKFFYDWLLEYVISSPVVVMVLHGEDAVSIVRNKLGDTNPEDASPDSIRGRYGLSPGINATHASDSGENGEREIEVWSEFLTERKEPRKRAEEYIEKYIDYPMIDPLRYKEVSERFLKDEITGGEAKRKFTRLLKKETDTPEENIEKFSEVMVKDVMMRKD